MKPLKIAVLVTACLLGQALVSKSFSCLFPTIQTGKASWYNHVGHLTANGERLTRTYLTAAHRCLPFGTMVRVTNIYNNLSVIVRINDRGPYIKGRIIDLSPLAADSIGIKVVGITEVLVEVIG